MLSTGPRIGSELVGYRIEAPLGRGGMSVVYRAEDLRLKRKVALKLLAADLAEDGRFRERFLRESRLAASIDHPHIVPVYEAGEVDGQLYLAMRYVEGTDLKALLRRERRLTPDRALTICADVADALDEAHGLGLVHRDVKPSNVLIDSHERSYLADFGLVKRNSDRTDLTASDEVLGTIDYVAPEMIEGKPVDRRVDVYSLGCLLFECLTGEVPFPRDSSISVLFAHVQEPPPKPSQRRPELPEALDGVIAKALAKAPDERYASCRELVEAAREALPAPASPESPSRRRRRLVHLVALIVLALAIVLPLTVIGGESEPASAPARASPAVGPTLAITQTSIQRIDPKTNRLVATIPVGATYPGGLALGAGFVWVADEERNAVYRIDPRTNSFAPIVERVEANTGLAFGGGSLWVLNPVDNTIAQVDPKSGTILHVRQLPEGFSKGGIAADDEQVWVAHATADGNLTVVEQRSLAARTANIAAGSNPATEFKDVALDRDAVWATGHDPRDLIKAGVSKVDRRTGEVLASVQVEGCGGCAGTAAMLAVGEEGVWVVHAGVAVAQVAPSGDRLLRIVRVASSVDAVAVGAGSVWAASTVDGSVSRIDPKSGRVLTTVKVGPQPSDLVADENGVWVAVRPA